MATPFLADELALLRWPDGFSI